MSINEMPAGAMVVALEMTPERRARMSKASGYVIDVVQRYTEGPGEALAVLQLVMTSLCETSGIKYRGMHSVGEVGEA